MTCASIYYRAAMVISEISKLQKLQFLLNMSQYDFITTHCRFPGQVLLSRFERICLFFSVKIGSKDDCHSHNNHNICQK